MMAQAVRQVRQADVRSGAAYVRAVAPELLVGLSAVLALALALYHLDRRPLWLDEATTYYVSALSWSRLLELLSTGAEGWHPPTYFIALKAWRVFGDSQVALRSFSVLFAVLTVPVIYLITRRLLVSRWVGAVAALVFACNAFAVRYAREARTYSLTMFLAAVAFWLFLRALETGSMRRWLAYAAVALLGIYSHVFFALLVLLHVMAMALPSLRPPSFRAPTIAFALVTLLTLPLVYASIGQTGSLVNWIEPMQWWALAELFYQFAGATPPAVLVYAVALVLALAWMIRSARAESASWLFLLWALVPPLGLAAASLVKPLFVARYLIISLPAITILVAIGITRLPRIPAAMLLGVTLLGMTLVFSGFAISMEYQRPSTPWDRVAQAIHREAGPSEGLVVWSHALKPLAYQVQRLQIEDEMPRVIFPARSWATNPYGTEAGQVTEAARRFASCGFERIWLVGGPRDLSSADDGRRKRISRILTAAYDKQSTSNVGVRLQLFVRTMEPCPG